MGNQMFEYAYARHIAHKHNTKVVMDLEYLLDRTPRENFTFRDYDMEIFNIQENKATTEDLKWFFNDKLSSAERVIYKAKRLFNKPHFVNEKGFNFQPELLNAPDNSYITGYFQSPKYFDGIEDIIRKEFTFKLPILEGSKALQEQIHNTNSICINVRRGDFVSNPEVNKVHGLMGLEFYNEGIRLMKEKVADPHFFVFSDDVEWCEANLQFGAPATFVGHTHKGHKFSNYLNLMSQCKHYFIPNSTFAWWAAWLNQNPNKIVIAPKNWFSSTETDTSGLIPDSWERI